MVDPKPIYPIVPNAAGRGSRCGRVITTHSQDIKLKVKYDGSSYNYIEINQGDV